MATSTVLFPSVYDFNMTFKSDPQPPIMAPSQRPKLSLNTAATGVNKRSFGKGSTGLRLDTLTDASPTSRNTCQNSFGLPSESPTSDSLKTKTRKPLFPRLQTAGLSENTSALPLSNTSSTVTSPKQSSRTSSPQRQPYSQPVEVRSILLNGPVSKRERPMQTPLSAKFATDDPKEVSSKEKALRSPSAKKVCFRDPVEEEIQTRKYLMRHSDLRSRSVSPAVPGTSLQMTPATSTSSESTDKPPPPRLRELAAKPRQGSDEEDEESSTLPKTPVAGRNQKDRHWRWTLGPLPKLAVEGSAIPGVESESSDSDLEASLGESVAAASAFRGSSPKPNEEQ